MRARMSHPAVSSSPYSAGERGLGTYDFGLANYDWSDRRLSFWNSKPSGGRCLKTASGLYGTLQVRQLTLGTAAQAQLASKGFSSGRKGRRTCCNPVITRGGVTEISLLFPGRICGAERGAVLS